MQGLKLGCAGKKFLPAEVQMANQEMCRGNLTSRLPVWPFHVRGAWPSFVVPWPLDKRVEPACHLISMPRSIDRLSWIEVRHMFVASFGCPRPWACGPHCLGLERCIYVGFIAGGVAESRWPRRPRRPRRGFVVCLTTLRESGTNRHGRRAWQKVERATSCKYKNALRGFMHVSALHARISGCPARTLQ